MRDMPLLTVMPTFKETLGRLMHQDPIFPKGHQLIGYHYSGNNNNKKKLFMLIASISCHVLSLCLSLSFSVIYTLAHSPNFTAFVFRSGSDSWTAEEKRFFNKGISAYRKDFFLVQKLVCSLI